MKSKLKLIIISLAAMLTLVFLSGCTDNLKEYKTNFESLDTQIFIKIYVNKDIDNKKILQDIEKIYKDYHQLTNMFENYEDVQNVKTINDNAGIEAVVVDKKLVDLLEFSKSYYHKTDGNFDITMGALLDVWYNYRANCLDNDVCAIPSESELNEAKTLAGIDKLEINKETNEVYLSEAGMKIDLGAVAKGYITQKAVEYLNGQNVKHFLIDAGGNVAVGEHYENENFKIGITDPNNINTHYEVVEATDKSIVTSGDYRRYYEVEGKKYHHIIDPKTLYPSEFYKSLTVVTDDSGISDVLSTTLFNMSVDDGKAIVDKLDGYFKVYWHKTDGTRGFYEKN